MILYPQDLNILIQGTRFEILSFQYILILTFLVQLFHFATQVDFLPDLPAMNSSALICAL